MLQITTFLQNLGFKLRVHSDGSFNGSYVSEKGIEIIVIYFDSIIGMQADNNDFKREILNSFKIHSVDELIYILSRNVFFKTQFRTLYKEMIQSQTLSNVKHS